jgi:hypothetical protein
MKRAGKIAICLAAVLTFNAVLRADSVVLPGNPYAPIVARNVFSLVPVPVVDTNATPVETPLKISPNGIMSLFGQLQVLFKVTGKPSGKVDSYILAEGQRQDEIEVVKIDQANGIVTFNNNGVVQTLPLANAPATGGSPAAAGGGNPGAPGFNPNNGNGNNGGGNGFGRFGNRGGGRTRGGQNAPGGNNFNGGGGGGDGDGSLNFRSVPTRTYQPEASQISPEASVIGVEVQRAQYQNEGNPLANLVPPTPLTPANNGSEGNGDSGQ